MQVTKVSPETPHRRPGFLIVLPWYPKGLGGVGQVVRNLLDQIAIQGTYEPILLVTESSARRLEERPASGAPRFDLRVRPAFGGARPWRTFAAFLAGAPSTVQDLLSLVKRYDIRVVNVHYVEPSAVLFGLLKRTGLYRGCLLLSVHGTDLHTAASAPWLQRALWKITFRLADRIVACSDHLREVVVGFDSKLTARVVTVCSGVDVRGLEREGLERWGLSQWLGSDPCILSVGTFDAAKGQDVLVKAFAQVAREVPNVRLVMVGKSGGLEGELRELVKTLGLSDRVALIRDMPHEGMSEFYSQATVFCLPSRREAFGLAVLEAGAFEVAVVATRVGGVPEVIEHGVTGRLVAPDEVSGLALELRSLLGDRAERAKLGAALRHKVEAEFTWTRTYSQYEAVIRDCGPDSNPVEALGAAALRKDPRK